MKSALIATGPLIGPAFIAVFAGVAAQAAPPRAGSGGAPTIGGGPCLPGRIGTCVGHLANNPMMPGDTLNTSSTWT